MIEGWIAEIERAQGLTEAQAFARVQAAVRAAGSQKELADGMGISREYLSDMLNNRRPISDGLLRAAGLRRVVTYVDDGGTR
jgi:transcriptional regulator with XRE-family HTH domain